jgi:molybdopterin molybdotransferase
MADRITGVVLAGGRGSRMGHRDKGLVAFRARPMVAHVIDRLLPQVDRVLVNANRNVETYAAFGHPVVADAVAGFAGPLAGLECALGASGTAWVATVPCDAPLLPLDLVARLRAAAEATNADVAVATVGGRREPVFCLCRRSLREHLRRFLDAGGRRVDDWLLRLALVEVPFDDEPEGFCNINTPDDLREAARDAPEHTTGRGYASPPEPMTTPKTLTEASCADDYDPNSMPVERAKRLIRQFLSPPGGALRVPVRAALGRVLAADIVSPVDVPAHANSAMDGYAFAHTDLVPAGPTAFSVAGTAFAGVPFDRAIGRGECVRIMTGGLIPTGADTVIMQERVQLDGGSVLVPPGQKRGQHVRPAGEDLRRGAVALAAGKLLRPADIGLIASLGIGEVSVFRPLRVAFFSTGDELVSIGSPLGPGQIYDSNRYTLQAMLARLGVESFDLGVVRDDPAAIEAAFRTAAAMADVVMTSGGVSVGEADFVKQMLNRLGEVLFWKIAMKPGRPLAYGRIGAAHFFGLPGNPVSVMVTFYQFVRDALLVLMGIPDPEPVPTLRAVCTTPLKKAPGRTEYQRGVLSRDPSGRPVVVATGDQGSGILRSMSEANCFIVLPDTQGDVSAGTEVDVQILEGFF